MTKGRVRGLGASASLLSKEQPSVLYPQFFTLSLIYMNEKWKNQSGKLEGALRLVPKHICILTDKTWGSFTPLTSFFVFLSVYGFQCIWLFKLSRGKSTGITYYKC